MKAKTPPSVLCAVLLTSAWASCVLSSDEEQMQRLRVTSYVPCLVGALALASGCAGPEPAPEPAGASAQSLDALCTELGPALVDHSCFHAIFGPFVSVASVAEANYPASAPNVNAVHTHFAITLPGGATGAHEGTIKYRPQRSGDWAIFTDPGVAMEVLDASDVARPALLQHDVPSCTQLPLVRVYELTAGATYRLRFTGSPTATVAVVVEKLTDFETAYFADSDEDSFGDPESLYSTSCLPPAGYVADDTDCDDDAASVNPGAMELCDEVDNDCDGEIDEDSLNACGTCGPVPVESCDSVDNDCDGTTDEGVLNACGACGAVPAEACDSVDNDCDGTTDEGVLNACGACGAVPAEACDSVDNDCDGTTDEGVLNACGTCGAVPSESCDGTDNDCDGATDEGVQNACGACGAVPVESCDSIDNDCDGRTDEGVQNACGACGSVPVESCDGMDNDCDGSTDEGVQNACGACGSVPVESCDGTDNDCDGTTDEGVQNACGACGAVPVESCDGTDNDCDGTTDEGVLNACGACGTAPVESCDGIDNDCNGVVDDAAGGCGGPLCGNGVIDEEEGEECDDGNAVAGDGCALCDFECATVTEAATDHTCLHADFGPFRTTFAQAYPGFVFNNINNPHTHFTISLPAGTDSAQAAVLYSPSVTGPFAFYSDTDAPVSLVRISDGVAVSLRLEHAVSTCSDPDSLTWLRVFELDEEEEYYVVMGPTPQTETVLVVEYLPSFGGLYTAADRDGDGWGDEDSFINVWCEIENNPFFPSDQSGDCDPESASVNPGATEVCNGIDDDCSGAIDDLVTVFRDADGDGYGDISDQIGVCESLAGYVDNYADCDDTNPAVHEGADELCDEIDNDCDGEIDEGLMSCGCVPASETCDGADNDCDGATDEGVLNACGTCGAVPVESCDSMDNDCDGRTDEGVLNACGLCGAVPSESCDGMDNDCDGSVDEGVVNACGLCGAVPSESCDGMDNDCDGSVDEGTGLNTYYPDADIDGYGAAAGAVQACMQPAGYVTSGDDCNDADAEINPGAEEVCNGADDNCNGEVDDIEDPLEHLIEHSCAHAQFGPFRSVSAAAIGGAGPDASQPHTAYTVELPQEGSSHGGELSLTVLHDAEYAILLGTDIALRVLDESGEEVEAEADDATLFCPELVRIRLYDLEPGDYRLVFGPGTESATLMVIEAAGAHEDEDEHEHEGADFFRDADADGFGDAGQEVFACFAPVGYVADDTDCDDGSADVNPAAEEICDEVDNDCDGEVDEGALNACGVCGELPAETCDGVDNDCDGEVDAVAGVSVCACENIVLTASRSYWPRAQSSPAVVELDHVASVEVPSEIELSQGYAGLFKYAVFSFRDQSTGRPRMRDCWYLGAGTSYRFVSCEGRYRPGQMVATDYLRFEIDGGFGLVPTVATLNLADHSCAP